MKRANVKIDFCNDKVLMLGQQVPIVFSKSGHYCVSISFISKEKHCENVVLLCNNISDKTHEDKKKVAWKLHRQFAHPRAEKLEDIVKTAGISDSQLLGEIRKIHEDCQVCKKYKKTFAKTCCMFSIS